MTKLQEQLKYWKNEALQRGPLPSSHDPIFRVKRCYNAGSPEEAAFQSNMASIIKAFRLGHITEEQARKLAERV